MSDAPGERKDVPTPRRGFALSGSGKLSPGRHNLPREFVVRSQLERMLDAVARAVAEKGYRGTTVTDVTARAGVSRTTFYENFSDMEACYLAAYDAIVPQFVASATVPYETTSGPWSERICRALDGLLRFCAAEPHFARACIVEVLAAGESALARRDAVMRGFESFFDPEMRPELGHPVSEPAFVAEAVVNALYGLIYSRVLQNRTHELPDLVPELCYVTLLPYLGDTEARSVAGLAG